MLCGRTTYSSQRLRCQPTVPTVSAVRRGNLSDSRLIRFSKCSTSQTFSIAMRWTRGAWSGQSWVVSQNIAKSFSSVVPCLLAPLTWIGLTMLSVGGETSPKPPLARRLSRGILSLERKLSRKRQKFRCKKSLSSKCDPMARSCTWRAWRARPA